MFKKIISLLFLCLSCLALNLKAQNSQTEAKAAYLLAEESYGKGDWSSAKKYLNTAKISLGSINSKILYLDIQIDSELYKLNKVSADTLLKK